MLLERETTSMSELKPWSLTLPPFWDARFALLEFKTLFLGHFQVGKLRCELSYRRCETSVKDMVRMIDVEVQGVEEIEKELEVGAIDINDIENR